MADTIKLGQLIGKGRADERDAVHIAIAPLEAGEILERGEPVVLLDGKAISTHGSGGQRAAYSARSLESLDAIGVVDPFLETLYVTAGQRFWLFMNPNGVTALRHQWTHPAFDQDEAPPGPAPDDEAFCCAPVPVDDGDEQKTFCAEYCE